MPNDFPATPDEERWGGRTYYGRSQLKPAPFNKVLVGSCGFQRKAARYSDLIAASVPI
jgi:hypothetical protein